MCGTDGRPGCRASGRGCRPRTAAKSWRHGGRRGASNCAPPTCTRREPSSYRHRFRLSVLSGRLVIAVESVSSSGVPHAFVWEGGGCVANSLVLHQPALRTWFAGSSLPPLTSRHAICHGQLARWRLAGSDRVLSAIQGAEAGPSSFAQQDNAVREAYCVDALLQSVQ